MKEARARRNEGSAPASPFAAWIFDAIERLSQQGGDTETQSLAILLGRIAVLIPQSDRRSEAIASLLALPQPRQTKRCLLAALALASDVISADLVLAGVRDWVEEARLKPWLHDASFLDAEDWLELLPFSDRPAATLEGIRLVNTPLRAPPRLMERVVAALGYAPSNEAEGVLVEMARENLHLVHRHTWFNAMIARGTVSAALAILDCVTDGSLTSGPGANTRTISRTLAGVARGQPALKAELLGRYRRGVTGSIQPVIEGVLAEAGDSASLLALAQSYAQSGRPFDGTLAYAINKTVVEQHPLNESSGTFEVRPVDMKTLRKDLFTMLAGTPQATAVVEASLTAIDQLRDEYGPPEFEPRHPDIESGRPWPLAAGGIVDATA